MIVPSVETRAIETIRLSQVVSARDGWTRIGVSVDVNALNDIIAQAGPRTRDVCKETKIGRGLHTATAMKLTYT